MSINILSILFAVAFLQASPPLVGSSGEVTFANGQTKPFIYLATVSKTPVNLSAVEVRYSRDLQEFFATSIFKRDRMPKMSLRGLKRIDLVPYSTQEAAMIEKIGSGCVKTDACTYRRVVLTFRSGKKESDIYIDLGESPRYAVGAEKQLYDLADYDVLAVSIK
jgi:hypothetical protein